MDALPVPFDRYDERQVTIRPLKGKSTRVDVEVRGTSPTTQSFETTDIVAQLRKFFDALEAEAADRAVDPIAMVTALANLDALVADVRFVRDTVRKYAADALRSNEVRRLAIEGVAAVEASTTLERKWDDDRLMKLALYRLLDPDGDRRWVEAETGEFLDIDDLAARLRTWFGISYWRMGTMREHGLDPDDYSTYPTGDDGRPAKTPSVTIKVNTVRRSRS